jgi:hypothetical protein
VASGKKLALAILAGTGLLLLASLANQLSYIYPTPETKSTFLKNYSPKPVIERF